MVSNLRKSTKDIPRKTKSLFQPVSPTKSDGKQSPQKDFVRRTSGRHSAVRITNSNLISTNNIIQLKQENADNQKHGIRPGLAQIEKIGDDQGLIDNDLVDLLAEDDDRYPTPKPIGKLTGMEIKEVVVAPKVNTRKNKKKIDMVSKQTPG